jgi:NADPH-dependent 2,4-dienoyl-CoA reductase/sulfur reductase-like enzyme
MGGVPSDVLIAGGGLAAQRAAETLRARGFDGPLRLVCAEPVRPYDRPPLSKTLLAGEVEDPSFRPGRWYAEQGVELLLGARAAGVDVGARRLRLADGSSLPYGELLVATGGRARTLPGPALTLRTLADARALRARLIAGARLVVIGAGFIGLEVAATARGLGVEVTVLDTLPVPLSRVLPAPVGAWFAALHRAEGVRLELGARVAGVEPAGVRLGDGRLLEADTVLVAIGSEPDADWLGFPGGVPVDACGRSGLPHVWAAGDVALAAGRCDHWEPAARQGAAVARAMLDLPVAPPAPLSAWTDHYGVRVHVLGEGAAADEVEVDGDPAARDFTAVLRRAGRPVGVVLAGRAHELPGWRRRLAAARTTHDPERTAA